MIWYSFIFPMHFNGANGLLTMMPEVSKLTIQCNVSNKAKVEKYD